MINLYPNLAAVNGLVCIDNAYFITMILQANILTIILPNYDIYIVILNKTTSKPSQLKNYPKRI